MTKNGKKLKATVYLSLSLHKGFPSFRKSLQPSKENISTSSYLIYS
jgi:hypothetical protein